MQASTFARGHVSDRGLCVIAKFQIMSYAWLQACCWNTHTSMHTHKCLTHIQTHTHIHKTHKNTQNAHKHTYTFCAQGEEGRGFGTRRRADTLFFMNHFQSLQASLASVAAAAAGAQEQQHKQHSALYVNSTVL